MSNGRFFDKPWAFVNQDRLKPGACAITPSDRRSNSSDPMSTGESNYCHLIWVRARCLSPKAFDALLAGYCQLIVRIGSFAAAQTINLSKSGPSHWVLFWSLARLLSTSRQKLSCFCFVFFSGLCLTGVVRKLPKSVRCLVFYRLRYWRSWVRSLEVKSEQETPDAYRQINSLPPNVVLS